ncbi:hypothetical protein KBD61_05280 [Patescibacteria group bacterium]|nr:hypothetical protein [Patescibacteria group bacterium]MBP9710402.1 hypothetical protein [Patescibacteria group bacterium]
MLILSVCSPATVIRSTHERSWMNEGPGITMQNTDGTPVRVPRHSLCDTEPHGSPTEDVVFIDLGILPQGARFIMLFDENNVELASGFVIARQNESATCYLRVAHGRRHVHILILDDSGSLPRERQQPLY